MPAPRHFSTPPLGFHTTISPCRRASAMPFLHPAIMLPHYRITTPSRQRHAISPPHHFAARRQVVQREDEEGGRVETEDGRGSKFRKLLAFLGPLEVCVVVAAVAVVAAAVVAADVVATPRIAKQKYWSCSPPPPPPPHATTSSKYY